MMSGRGDRDFPREGGAQGGGVGSSSIAIWAKWRVREPVESVHAFLILSISKLSASLVDSLECLSFIALQDLMPLGQWLSSGIFCLGNMVGDPDSTVDTLVVQSR